MKGERRETEMKRRAKGPALRLLVRGPWFHNTSSAHNVPRASLWPSRLGVEVDGWFGLPLRDLRTQVRFSDALWQA